MINAYHRRTDNQMQLLAWHASNIMQMWAAKGKRIRADDLLPRHLRTKASAAQPASPEEFHAAMQTGRDSVEEDNFWGSNQGDRIRKILMNGEA